MSNNKHEEEAGMDHHQENSEVQRLWEESEANEIVRQLKAGESMSQVFSLNREELLSAFEEASCEFSCSDGRISEHRLARAGAGIVAILKPSNGFEGPNYEAGVDSAVEAIGRLIGTGEIRDRLEISSHHRCGAAAIVFNELQKTGNLPAGIAEPDELGKKFVKDLAGSVAVKYPQISVTTRHIEKDEMAEIHNERVIYFDGTGRINIGAAKELPSGFTFTDMNLPRTETVTELKALCGIALDPHHGFGTRFTAENPFRIIISAESPEQLESLKSIAEEAVQDFAGRVVVDGYSLRQ